MVSWWKKWSAELTPGFLGALVLAAGFMAFVAWDQSHWWRVKEDYGFGWLVPAFVAFVVYDRGAKIRAAVQACAAPGSARAGGLARWTLRIGAGAALALGAVMFLLGAFYRAGAGSSQPGTLAITIGMIGIVLPLLFLNSPENGGIGGRAEPAFAEAVADGPVPPSPSAQAGLFDDARVRLVLLFIFPVLVWLVSAPMVSVVESQLNLFLLRKVVTVVSGVFDLLGLPIEQQGNVLVLPNGSVGVEDACSGIRSLTGCLFAGSFLAAVFLDKLWKKIALVAAAMVLAFLTNLIRGLFLTGWAYHYGSRAIEGTVHDVAGYSVLGLTVIGLLCLLPLFNFRLRETEEGSS
ncbi:MAG TPA: exosortase/archaeosortase family protein [Opitutus sp.]|nr:exosortase/archaeosortase family protein [Opitutus sp.]